MSLIRLLNRDFNIGYHHFTPNKPFADSLVDFFDHEVDLYSRRFRVDEKDGVTTLSLDLPGFKSTDLDIQLERGILTIKAKNARDEIDSSINVGVEMDPDKVEAKLEDGVLTLTLHRLESTKARKVAVK
jgi:HSP20 family molecular chaperone IbpA